MRRRTATTFGLVVLLLIDIALVALAFRNPIRGVPTPVASAISSTGAGLPTAGATGGVQPPPTTPPPASTQAIDGGVHVTVVPIDGSRAWRFTPGNCRAGGATLDVTTNGGAKWTKVESPLGAITRLQATDADRVLLVGSQGDCRVTTLRSTDAGLTWAPGGPVQVWFKDLDKAAEVTNSNGRTSTPCGQNGSVVSLVGLSAGAALALCAEGKTMETADAGASWVETARGVGPLAIDAQVAAGRLSPTLGGVSDACAGLAITKIVNGASSRIGCVDVGIPLGPQLRGRMSLAAAGDSWWLAIGTDTFRSADSGKTWSRS